MREKIRVIEARRHVVDVSAPIEELTQILDEIRSADPSLYLEGFIDIAERLRGPLGVFAPLGWDVGEIRSDAIMARELFMNPAVVPVITARGGSAVADRLSGGRPVVRTRFAGRTRALYADGSATAVAAEEPVEVSGAKADRRWAVALTTQTSVLAALRGPVRMPFVGSKNGFDVAALLRQTRAAIDFYRSGAATFCLALPPTLPPVPLPAPPLLAETADNDRLRYLIKRLARTETTSDAPAAWTYSLSLLNELARMGALYMYLEVLTNGRSSAILDEFLDGRAIQFTRVERLREIGVAARVASNLAKDLLNAVEDKIGVARAAELRRLAVPLLPEMVLALLKPRERALVEAAAESRRQHWAAASANRCPHVALAMKMRHAGTAAESLRLLQELLKFAAPPAGGRPKKSEATFLMCRNCEFRLVCPHVRDRVEMEGRRAPAAEVRARLLEYALPDSPDSYLYCRLCAERLGAAAEEASAAELLGRYGNLDSELRTRIWAVAMTAAGRMRFAIPTEDRWFAGAAADVVYPLLVAALAAAEQRRRRRVRAEDGIDPRTLMYVHVFVYAYVLNVIRTTPGVTLAGMKPGARLTAVADRLLETIGAEHFTSQIEDITPEFVAARFAEALQLIRGELPDPLQVSSVEEEFAIQTLTVDPIYRYAASIARIVGDLPFDAGRTPAAVQHEFKTILGAPITEIIRTAHAQAQDPRLAPLFQRRMGAEVPPGGSIEFLLKSPKMNLYTNIYVPAARPPAAVGGARLTASSTAKPSAKPSAKPTAKPSAKPIHSSLVEAYRLFTIYTRVDSQAAFDAYAEQLEKFRERERVEVFEMTLKRIKPYYDFKYATSPQFIEPSPEERHDGIAALYGEDGHRHDWTKNVIYVFASPSGEVIVDGTGNGGARVKAARAAGKLADASIIDLICPTCMKRQSVLRTAVQGAAISQTWESVRALANIDAFYAFYDARCPEKGLHDFTAKGVCKKCAYDGEKSRAYYDKYIALFNAEKVKAAPALPALPEAAPSAPAVPPALPKPDYGVVLRAAALVQATAATIEAIGSMEGREYEDVVEGKGVPLPPRAGDYRLYAIDAEVRFFQSEYGVYSRLNGVDANLSASDADYRAAWMAAQASGASVGAELQTAMIQTLCRIAVEVSVNHMEFAQKVLSLILRGQKLFSKPGVFNWAIFEVDDTADDGVLGDAGDVGEDVRAEQDEANSRMEEPNEDPFSDNTIDYDAGESNPNNEPP